MFSKNALLNGGMGYTLDTLNDTHNARVVIYMRLYSNFVITRHFS